MGISLEPAPSGLSSENNLYMAVLTKLRAKLCPRTPGRGGTPSHGPLQEVPEAHRHETVVCAKAAPGTLSAHPAYPTGQFPRVRIISHAGANHSAHDT